MKKPLTNSQVIRKRIKTIALYEEGLQTKDIAENANVQIKSVKKWVSIYKEFGIRKILRYKFGKRRCRLSPEQIAELRFVLRSDAMKEGFPDNRWTTKRVAEYIEKKYGVQYSVPQMGRILRRNGYKTWNKDGGMSHFYLLTLFHILNTRTPSDYGYKEKAWSVRLIGNVGYDIFGVRYSNTHIYQKMKDKGWYFEKSQVKPKDILRQILELIQKEDATKHGFDTKEWTASRIIALGKKNYDTTLNKPQIYEYMRRNGFPLGKQYESKKTAE